MINPFDKYPAEYVALHCDKCRAVLFDRFPVVWPESHPQNWRLDKWVQHALASHRCTQVGMFQESPPLRKLIRKEDQIPDFKIGSYCINIFSGYIWQIETEHDLEIIVTAYKNGSKTVQLYI